jgi:hypothetical protein
MVKIYIPCVDPDLTHSQVISPPIKWEALICVKDSVNNNRRKTTFFIFFDLTVTNLAIIMFPTRVMYKKLIHPTS